MYAEVRGKLIEPHRVLTYHTMRLSVAVYRLSELGLSSFLELKKYSDFLFSMIRLSIYGVYGTYIHFVLTKSNCGTLYLWLVQTQKVRTYLSFAGK